MGFYEIETPMLTRSTPEGARDYLVPSRVHPGQFYALPQSPQIFKQILMIGGMDRYFQIVKCFRDEDLRADRQPEFTQLDLEMSFPTQDAIFGVIENVMVRACAVAGITVKGPFRRMEYKEAIRRYGSDKPDLRFGMELHDVTEHFAPARETLHIEGNVQALAAPGAATFSRKQLDEIAEKAKSLGARGVYTIKVTAEGVTSPLEKNLGAETLKKIAAAVEAKPGDLVVAVTAKEQIPGTDAAALIAGQLRLLLADQLKLIPTDRWEFVWITGFALFEWNTTDKSRRQRAASLHRHRRGRRFETRRPLRRSAPVHAFERLRPRPERRRTRLGQHSNSPAGTAGSRVQDAGPQRGAAAQPLRLLPRRADVRDAAARRHRAGPGPRHGAARGRKIDPRSHRISENGEGAGFDGGSAVDVDADQLDMLGIQLKQAEEK